MLIDTHAHLFWESFNKDLDQVIDRALQAGVTTIINIGVDSKTSKIAVELKSDKIHFFSTIGIHPEESPKFYHSASWRTDVSIREDMNQLSRMYEENISKVVMVGECGLDFSYTTPLSAETLKNIQIKLFQAQIELAEKLNLPLSVHCRDDRSRDPDNSEAWDKVLDMVGDHPAILHCYSGLLLTTKKVLLSHNLLVSFSGMLTYPKNDYLIEAVKLLSLDRMVLETDSPFLPPQGKRGKRNEPSFITETAQMIADIKGISLEEVANQTTENFACFLRLK